MQHAAMNPSLAELHGEARSFHHAFASLLMATASPDGEPVASYAPYVTDATGCFCIYISELATHTANLMHHPKVSVLFIEDESQSQHLFARKRMTYACKAEEIGRDQPGFIDIMNTFEKKHGPFMNMLRGLRDFHLFRLIPEHATYVRGFAQAFKLSGAELSNIRPVGETGHRSGDP